MMMRVIKNDENSNQQQPKKRRKKKIKKKPLTQNKSFKKNLLNRNFIKQKNII